MQGNEIFVAVILFLVIIIVFLLALVAWLAKKNAELGGTAAQLIPQEFVVKAVESAFQQFGPLLQALVTGTKNPIDNAGYNWLEKLVETMVAQHVAVEVSAQMAAQSAARSNSETRQNESVESSNFRVGDPAVWSQREKPEK